MGLFDKLRNEFIDIIEWTDDTNDTMVWRFPRYQNEIKMNAKLVVRETQTAVFINEGRLADVFQPGTHTLSTENMPILSTLLGWKYGFNSPFKAEVYFINTKNFVDQKWGTINPVTVSDERFGMIELRAFGTYTLKVIDPVLFIKEVVGTDGNFTTQEIGEQLRSLIRSRFTDAIGESNVPIERIASNMDELGEIGMKRIEKDFTDYGLKVTKFLVENISMPEELKKEIFEYSRLNKIDLNKLTQMKAAKAIEEAAKNPNGNMGAGMGMGMGFGMSNMMANTMNQHNQANTQTTDTPPPLNSLQYFVAVNNQQTGPFTQQVLTQMIQQGALKKDSLVWKTGMAAWAQAGSVSDLAELFNTTPPPLV